MKLHDEFHDKDLVIIGVHNDSARSIEEMDQKLVSIKQWGGARSAVSRRPGWRGRGAIKGSAAQADGATTAAYGVTSFPTTVIIGKDGKLRSYSHADGKDAALSLKSF